VKFSPICTGVRSRGGELGACDVIVVAYWLLDPVQALLVKLAAALAGGAGAQRLVGTEALGGQFLCLVGGGLRLQQSQPVAVVGRRWPCCAAERPGQRSHDSDRERIPAGDVDAGQYCRDQATGPKELEPRLEDLSDGGGSGGRARQGGADVAGQGDRRVACCLKVAGQVRPPVTPCSV
jgi:hypothetical protein